MAEAHAKPHHAYHLVNPSPWPLIGASFVFLTAVGLIMSMKGLAIGGLKLGVPCFGIGVLGLFYTLASWWTDVVHDSVIFVEVGKQDDRQLQAALRHL